jgi:HEAT repeat protein
MLLALLALPAVGALDAGVAIAQSRPAHDVRARVEQALLSFDRPPPASFWEALGDEGLAALVAIVDDGRLPVGLRRRAASAARHYRSPASRLFLSAVAASTGEDELVSRHALLALADAFGASALDELLARLTDPRAMVREGAALALARTPLPAALRERARGSLLAARAAEPELFVRVAMDRAEATLATSPGTAAPSRVD